MSYYLTCSGALFYSVKTHRLLFLHRSSNSYSGVWGLVGGKNEELETPWQGLLREIQEEVGSVTIIKPIPLELFTSENNFFSFHTYLCIVKDEFIPVLNHEHDGYAWCSFAQWPSPLHPGLQATLSKDIIHEKIKTVLDVVDLLGVE